MPPEPPPAPPPDIDWETFFPQKLQPKPEGWFASCMGMKLAAALGLKGGEKLAEAGAIYYGKEAVAQAIKKAGPYFTVGDILYGGYDCSAAAGRGGPD